MFVTFETSHPETFNSVSDAQCWKAWLMFARLLVSQPERSSVSREMQSVNMHSIVLHLDMSSFETSAVFRLRTPANQNAVPVGAMPLS